MLCHYSIKLYKHNNNLYNYCIKGLSFMNRIKELRESKGMTQVRLSIELEVSQETVSAYEKGKHYPSVEVLMKLLKFLTRVSTTF